MSSKMIRTGLYDDNNRLGEHIKTESETDGRLRFLHQAYSAFEVFKPLFSDLPFELSKHFRDDHMVYLNGKSEEEAFEMIGVELDFLYDLLFTKLPILHGRSHAASLILRLFSFFSCISMMIAFSIYCKSRDHHIPDVDLAITYLLLGQPIVLDTCTYLLHSSRSNWVALKSHGHKFYSLSVSPKPRRIKTEMGIKEMAQHDLINYYVMQAGRGWISQVVKVIDTNDLIQKFWYTNWRPVDLELKRSIYSHLKDKRKKCEDKGFDVKFVSELLDKKGEAVMDRYHFNDSWKIETTDFTSRIFVWHIATELVYYDDVDKLRGPPSSLRKTGKALSDYMVYLVLVRPLMLPKGFNELINKKTYTQAAKFFHYNMRKNSRVARKEFTRALLSYNSDDSFFIYGTTSSSIENVLFKGQKFAKQLQELVRKERWDDEEKWELISELWMEMLIYAASHCSWKEHAQELRHGGELLTHVALLMAHFGLSTQIQNEIGRGDVHGMPLDNLPPFAI